MVHRCFKARRREWYRSHMSHRPARKSQFQWWTLCRTWGTATRIVCQHHNQRTIYLLYQRFQSRRRHLYRSHMSHRPITESRFRWWTCPASITTKSHNTTTTTTTIKAHITTARWTPCLGFIFYCFFYLIYVKVFHPFIHRFMLMHAYISIMEKTSVDNSILGACGHIVSYSMQEKRSKKPP